MRKSKSLAEEMLLAHQKLASEEEAEQRERDAQSIEQTIEYLKKYNIPTAEFKPDGEWLTWDAIKVLRPEFSNDTWPRLWIKSTCPVCGKQEDYDLWPRANEERGDILARMHRANEWAHGHCAQPEQTPEEIVRKFQRFIDEIKDEARMNGATYTAATVLKTASLIAYALTDVDDANARVNAQALLTKAGAIAILDISRKISEEAEEEDDDES